MVRALMHAQLTGTDTHGAAGHQHHLMTGVLQICQHRYQLGHPGNIGFACVVGQSRGAYFDHNAFFLRQLHYTLLQVT